MIRKIYKCLTESILKVLTKLKNLFQDLDRNFSSNSIREKNISNWIAENGDRTLRLFYDLDKNSVVFDVGGYIGQWSSDIFSMYCCNIHIFEPVKGFAEYIEQRFHNNNKIHIHPFGLASANRETEIFVNNDSSSVYTYSGKVESIELVDFMQFVRLEKINHIDLIKINIEGGEYELLEYLIKNNFVNSMDNIQVQFHEFIEDSKSRMLKIQKSLSDTHRLTYQYPFVWENWKKK